MPSATSLITRLSTDYPNVSFVPSDHFRWSATDHTVFIDVDAMHADAFCLHEVSHAILDHREYNRDIDLVKLERDAWEHVATTLAKKYEVKISEDIIQDNLDTYRDWLHARSTCPTCQATGVQATPSEYRCIACKETWHVNEARICALRRYTNKKYAS
jgi:hypothetical protein